MSDEDEIRQLVSTWMEASRTGDVEAMLSLMTEDIVFLIPGRPPMHKAEFAEVSRAQAGPDAPKFDGKSEIQEIQVLGDWAFMWAKLKVIVTPNGGDSMVREGHTLTILKRQNGHWALARDANLLAAVPGEKQQTSCS